MRAVFERLGECQNLCGTLTLTLSQREREPPPYPRYVSRLKMLCDRLVVYGRILVGHSPFSDSACHPALLGTPGESMSYTAAYRAIPGALVDSSR